MVQEKIKWDEYLREHGVNPTRVRLIIARYLFEKPNFHFRAEELFVKIKENHEISLATIYNTIEIFVNAGLLREIKLMQYSIFDTNTSQHHHFLDETSGNLIDIPLESVEILAKMALPDGKSLKSMDLVIRVG